MGVSGSAVRAGRDPGEQRLSALWDEHRRHLGYVLGGIILLGIGAWFYVRSNSLKAAHADQAYEAALQSVAAGNIPLAESDLKKVTVRYAGTNGGTEAAMALAKLYYEQGKYREGIAALKGPAGSGGDLQYGALLLLGDGYQGLGQLGEAAATFERAAGAARFDLDRSTAMARAARAFQQSNNAAAAVRIWNELLRNPNGGFSDEAKVRLGELEARPVKV